MPQTIAREMTPQDGAAQQAQKSPLWSPAFFVIMLLGFLIHMTTQMITPQLAAYSITRGASLTTAATISSMMSIAALCCRPFTGILCDRTSRKRVMAISSAGVAISVFGYAIAKDAGSMIALRILHGASYSFLGVSNMAFASAYIPADRMGEGFAYMNMGNILATALGPNLGLWLTDRISYTGSFTIAGVFSLLSALLVILMPKREEPKRDRQPQKLSFDSFIDKRILLYAMIMSLFVCGAGLMNTYIKLIGEERAIPGIALYYTMYSAVVVVARPLTGKLSDRRGLIFVMLPSLLFAATGMVLIGVASALWMILLAGVFNALGQGVASPATQSYCVKMLGREKAGVASSTCFIGMDIGASVAPIAGSFIIKSYGYGTLFYGYAALLVAGGATLFFIQKALERRWRQAKETGG